MEIAELPLYDDTAFYEDNIFEFPSNKLASRFVCDVLFAENKVQRVKFRSRAEVVTWKLEAIELSPHIALFVNGEIMYSPAVLLEQAKKTSELLKITLL